MHESYIFKNLQGLRAVAVLTVIAFHFGFPVSGGFLGVDLFFLISGFIIPHTLYREIDKNGRVGLRQFYLRRIHRLFPASILTVFLTLSVSLLISTPEIAEITAKSSVAGLLIYANYLLEILGNNYFSPSSQLNPLLHYWSLSVEEQTYIFLAILIGMYQIRRQRIFSKLIAKVIFWFLFLISLILWLKPRDNDAQFSILFDYFSTIVRLWEFSLGALLLVLFRKYGHRYVRKSQFFDFFFLSIFTFLLFSTVGNTPLTNLKTTIFLIAASYFIYPSSQSNLWTQKLLASKPFQYVGNRSYSFYLTHWPTYVLLKSTGLYGKRLVFIASVLTFAITVLFYRYTENVYRRIKSKNTYVILIAFIVTFTFASTSIYLTSEKLKNYNRDLASSERYIGSVGHPLFFNYIYKHMNRCLPLDLRVDSTKDGFLHCWQSKASNRQDIVLFGDSHSEHLFPGFAKAFPKLNVVYFDAFGSPTNNSPHAAKIVDYILTNRDVKYVFISSFWIARGVDAPKLRILVKKIQASGKQVFLTSDVPSFRGDPFYCKYGVKLSRFTENPCLSSFKDQAQITSSNIIKLNSVIRGIPEAKILNTTQPFCSNDFKRCEMTKNGKILYRDPNHLNVLGSIFAVEYLVRNGDLSLKS
jgi:peptidoglycan/LPS O-acetylase OafA/YrhL